jgi:Asp-tRNA(Asn)/Glu-tRNA(Gln) amidotransferase A subunit family amidase
MPAAQPAPESTQASLAARICERGQGTAEEPARARRCERLNERGLTADNGNALDPTRRQVLQTLAALGVGSAVFQRAVAAQAQPGTTVTPEMIQQAEWVAGLKLSEADRKSTALSLQRLVGDFEAMRRIPLDNSVAPALVFHPSAGPQANDERPTGTVTPSVQAAPKRPDSAETLAFMPTSELSALIRTKQISSVELTKLYLQRLRQYDPTLHCVVNLTENVALKQAEQADREIAAGRYRGPLHGIPWGAKDLIAYPGYPTTWGAAPYKDRVIDTKATVARRLEDAGAVLAAKLTLGALAMGDKWFGGLTRNPWNVQVGSSGSSAGPASASAAGLVGFTLGSETLGSIISPCVRCGATGLRPTFGRVSRHGCMTLSWSMDKIGPIARSVEDCALVFGAIHGADGLDASAVNRPFSWPSARDLRSLRVGYPEDGRLKERPEFAVLRDVGVQLVPLKIDIKKHPLNAMLLILTVEAATAFDDVPRHGPTEGFNEWPHTFRRGQFVPAVEYLRANRLRTLLIKEMEELLSPVDVLVADNALVWSNLTGHPMLVLPNGFRKAGDIEVPTSLTFTGRLFGETELLAVGHAYQQATGFHLRRPPLDKPPPKPPEGKGK